MLALVYKSAWDVALEERPVPEITRDNQVLVRIRATGVCGTDLGIVSGKYHAVPISVLSAANIMRSLLSFSVMSLPGKSLKLALRLRHYNRATVL